MKLISYLFQNRVKYSFGTWLWLKYWLKRLRTSPALLKMVLRSNRLRKYCKKFGDANAVSKLSIHGNSKRVSIGSFCAIGRIEIQTHEDVVIGNCVVINDGCNLITGSHDVHHPAWPLTASPITIGDYAWIATGACVLPGVSIGKGAVVGAFAVVSKSVPDNAIVVGNPAKIVGHRQVEKFEYRPSDSYATFEAWLGKPVDYNHREATE